MPAEWVCPCCAYTANQQIGLCPLCQIPLARKARPKTDGPKGGAVTRPAVSKWPEPQAGGWS